MNAKILIEMKKLYRDFYECNKREGWEAEDEFHAIYGFNGINSNMFSMESLVAVQSKQMLSDVSDCMLKPSWSDVKGILLEIISLKSLKLEPKEAFGDGSHRSDFYNFLVLPKVLPLSMSVCLSGCLLVWLSVCLSLGSYLFWPCFGPTLLPPIRPSQGLSQRG